MCLIYTDFQVFISFTLPLAGFYGKNLEKIAEKVLLFLQANKLAQLLNK
jgi:hypothetical protein